MLRFKLKTTFTSESTLITFETAHVIKIMSDVKNAAENVFSELLLLLLLMMLMLMMLMLACCIHSKSRKIGKKGVKVHKLR